jgi:hypothetical protein
VGRTESRLPDRRPALRLVLGRRVLGDDNLADGEVMTVGRTHKGKKSGKGGKKGKGTY